MPSIVAQDLVGVNQAGGLTLRQVDLGDVAGDDHLGAEPIRVRNIFICSGVVFCASSRMMNESLSVRPRMNASGATSIVPSLHERFDASASIMS